MVAIKKAVGIYDIYFNGSKVISDVTKVANISTQFRFGNWWSGMMVPMTGVATVQSYNRALSAAEVLQNYNAQKSRFGL
jgi:predicted acetyltransferase